MPDTRRLVARWIGWSPVSVWGTAPVERLRRSLARAGVWDAGPWTGAEPPPQGTVLLLLGDHIYDDALVAALVEGGPVLVVRGDGRPVAARVPADQAKALARVLADGAVPPDGLACRRGRDLVAPDILRRRRRAGPLVMPVSAELRQAVEDRLFDMASPATANLIERLVWPTPARALCRWAVRLRLSPAQLGMVSVVLVVLAILLFQTGRFGSGLVVAWGASMVQAADGRLARLTLSFSQLAAGMGHAVALAQPPLWWWAWWAGGGGGTIAMLILVAASIAVPMVERAFRWRTGFPIDEWRGFDAAFRLAAADRTTLLVPLTLGWLAGMPGAGLAVAALWQGLSLSVLGVRLAQSWRTRPQSWLRQADWKSPEPPPI